MFLFSRVRDVEVNAPEGIGEDKLEVLAPTDRSLEVEEHLHALCNAASQPVLINTIGDAAEGR